MPVRGGSRRGKERGKGKAAMLNSQVSLRNVAFFILSLSNDTI